MPMLPGFMTGTLHRLFGVILRCLFPPFTDKKTGLEGAVPVQGLDQNPVWLMSRQPFLVESRHIARRLEEK